MISITISGENAGEVAKNISDLDARLNGAKASTPIEAAVEKPKKQKAEKPKDGPPIVTGKLIMGV